ncbi:MAG: ABC transporter ATP-binding protein [Acidilobaceae archaeon]|nr:ABC transporter ATP-binding protein [Acidilobaceae archaeon]MCX8165168.1 ABC transporter ATP-binding protein [Acidilobaceae archaeon]MDW7974316.1 ABC transporter ATP-binding protein [Sulfolobales archaeon]
MALLEVENLKTYYFTLRGPVKAVDDVSFELEKGRILGIAGESGCGKSTLAWSLLGMVPPPGKIAGGSIYLDGVDIAKMSEEELRRKVRWKRISMIFQGAMNSLNPVYTAGAQIEEVLTYHGKMSKQDARKRVYELLESVGLDRGLANRYPHELSGGQKQRVVIAMALALEPDVVIADEPTTALDVVVQAQILNLLKKLQREKGISVILITHDLAVIAELADEVAIMYGGKIAEYGTSEQIFYKPRHPYTYLLMKAVPKLKGPKESLIYIPGQPPDLVSPPKGCRFAPRCPWAMDICSNEPEEVVPEKSHRVACWLEKVSPGQPLDLSRKLLNR